MSPLNDGAGQMVPAVSLLCVRKHHGRRSYGPGAGMVWELLFPGRPRTLLGFAIRAPGHIPSGAITVGSTACDGYRERAEVWPLNGSRRE